MSNSMTLAIERIADDARFAERFRRSPQRALRRYRLSAEQIEVVKRADPRSLTDHGVDIVAFSNGERHGLHRYWRKFVVACSVTVATIGFAVSPASAFDDGKRITGVRKASLAQARQGRAIRIGRTLILGSSIRQGLRRNGIRVGAPGRRALRAGLRRFCNGLDANCVIKGVDVDPIVLAD